MNIKVRDFLNRIKFRFLLNFTRDENKRKELWICYSLNSVKGRRALAEVMIQPIRRG